MDCGPILPISWVGPSGPALATSVEPMTPPAPDLLSTTQDWPQLCCRKAASRRATMSVVPPGAAGTTMRVLAAGFQGASALGPPDIREGSRAAAGKAAVAATRARWEKPLAHAVPLHFFCDP